MDNSRGFFFTSNGYEYLEQFLVELYGERGKFSHNLERYAYSEEFHSACRAAKTIDDFTEITFDQIKTTVEREEHFQRVCRNMIEKYDRLHREHQLSVEDVLAVAGILGLAGGPSAWYDTLLPHVCDLFFTREEIEAGVLTELEQRLYEKKKVVEAMVNTVLDGMRRGQIMKNRDGRLVFSQGYVRNLWRGENQYYGSSKALMFRGRPEDKEEGLLHDVIAELKLIEFSLWLKSLEFVQKWPYGDVYHGAVAQHYGIATNAMDVSGDLKTALFFACTKYEPKTGRFRKLLPSEYAQKDSRGREPSERDARYGLLYQAPYDVINMSIATHDPHIHFTSADPIGYQPFLRCSSQFGFVIETGSMFDLCKDGCFAKFKFRHDPEIVDWIFDKMDSGIHVYPREVFGSLEEIVDEIKSAREFSEAAFDRTMEHMKLAERKDLIRRKLQSRGYTLVSDKTWCSPEKKQKIEADFRANLADFEAALPDPRFRFGFSI